MTPSLLIIGLALVAAGGIALRRRISPAPVPIRVVGEDAPPRTRR